MAYRFCSLKLSLKLYQNTRDEQKPTFIEQVGPLKEYKNLFSYF
ncbi:MAG: hypothetical protein RLZZ321_1674 [Bacteroidota bacterium]|jgi:hypothetical protein